jgi:hypothetical protein
MVRPEGIEIFTVRRRPLHVVAIPAEAIIHWRPDEPNSWKVLLEWPTTKVVLEWPTTMDWKLTLAETGCAARNGSPTPP